MVAYLIRYAARCPHYDFRKPRAVIGSSAEGGWGAPVEAH